MHNSALRDLKANTLLRPAGAAPTLTHNTAVNFGAIDLQSLPARPASVCFDIPIEMTIGASKSFSWTGKVQKSANNSDWVDIPNTSDSKAYVPGDTIGEIRLGADLLQSDARYVRAQVTPQIVGDPAPTITLRGLSVLFGGLDETSAVARADRSVV